MPLTSNTLELTWSFSDVTNKYTIERDGTEPSFTKATVECPGPSLCYGYFVDLTAEHSYTCSVSNDGEINKITDTSPQMPADTKDFSVKQLNLIWNREVNAAAATVCVDINYEVKDAEEASYHQLIMINSQGQVLKTQQVVQKTESLLCFEGVHLETSTFDVSRGKVTMVVVKRRADGHTILARGQSELFFISPEMGRVGGQAGRVSWKNPGGYSFTARREGQLAPLSTSTNGSLVHYFIPKATGPKDVLVVETEAADVKMTVVVPLTPRVTPVKKQDGSVSQRNLGAHVFATRREHHPDPPAISLTCHNCTDNLIAQVSRKNMTSRQDSAFKVIGKSSLNSQFNDLPGLTIKYMTFPITKSPVKNSVETLVNVECTEDVTDADSLALTFIIPVSEGASQQYVDVADVAGISKVSTDVKFLNMDDTAFLPGAVAVEVVGHGKGLPVAYGRAILTLRDPEDTAWRVGKREDASYEAFRISFSGSADDTGGAQLGYDSPCECLTSPCYCLGSATGAQEPIPFCLKLKNTASTTDETILQCNDQLEASNSDTDATVTSVKMTQKTSGTVDVAVDVTFDNKMELLFYGSGDTTLHDQPTTCSDPASTCTVNNLSLNSDTVDYSVLLVTTGDNSDVKESSLLAFEDYKTKVTQLTSDAMEVHFSARTKTLYQVTVTPDGGAFDYTTVECGAQDNNKCYVYFITMKAGTGYEATVQHKEGGDLNKVAAQFVMEPPETKEQKDGADRVSWRSPGDRLLTGNLTTLASGINLGSQLPQQTHKSATKVDFPDLPSLTVKYMTFPITKSPAGNDVMTLVDVEGAGVTAANSLTLAFIVDDGVSATRHYVDVTDLQASTEVTFDHMNDNAFVPGPVTVVVAGHRDDEPAAYGQAQVTLRDPEDTAWRVGKREDASYEAFRISFSGSADDTGGAQLGYDSSCECHTSPCYCLGSAMGAQEPQPFCLKLKNTASTTDETILQCNDQLIASNSDTEAAVTSVKMTHKTSGTVDVAVDVTADSHMELLFYGSGDTTLHDPSTTCSDPASTCTVHDLSLNSDTVDYSVLVVTTGDKSNVKSSLLAFEDYKTKVTQLTSDAMEVRFSARTKTPYQVTVTPDVGAFSSKTIECTESDQCTQYFFSMKTGTEYEATVQQREGGDLNKVAAQFVMEPLEKFSRDATLHLRDEENKTLLAVCVDGSLPRPSGDYILVLTNGLNNTVIEKGPLIEENRCFSEVSLDLQLSQRAKIMVLTDEEAPIVALETDVHILDPASADISVTQVGRKALKATWRNRNPFDLEYEVGLDGAGDKVECKAQQECIKYIHLNSSTGATKVTIKENNDGTVQVVSVQVTPATIPELTIQSRSIQWDDRLRVCFNRTATADTYELGLEKDALHLQTSVHAQVDTHVTLQTCIVSTDTVDVGAYVDLWMVVTAFDASGVIEASGESTWNTILLSSSRNVRVAIKGTSIFTAWYLLDDPLTIDNFQVILRSPASENVFTVSSTQSAYTVTNQISGTYTVCVKAEKQVPARSTIDSEEVCSDIIVLSNNDEPIPDVKETKPKSTATDAVLLTWQPPQDDENVSGYFVSWTNAITSGKRSPRRLPPQSLARSHEELRQEVTGDEDSNFVIVPATDTSAEVTHLQEGAKYTFCVSSIVHDVVAQASNCIDTNLGDFTPLYTPSLSSPSKGKLEWTDNNTESVTFLVQWRSPSEEGHEEVKETSYQLLVAPGEWVVSVRAINAGSSSAPSTTTVLVSGVVTTVIQESSRKMGVTWSEEPTPLQNKPYTVSILQDEDILDVNTLDCSGNASNSDCSYGFSLDNDIQQAEMLTVRVSMTPSTEDFDRNFTMEPISGVSSLAQTIRSSSEVEVEWQPVENARYYQLSLYENESLSNRRWMKHQAMPLRVTLQEEDMIGNVLVVQACIDDLHCGDATTMTIQTPGTSSGSAVVGAVLGGVLGVTILACGIFFFVKRQQVKKKEREALNNIQSDQEMAPTQVAPTQNVYDEWGARRLGQPVVNRTPDNIS